ncbi:lipase member N isoform X2 [Acinonyx jubatus]|uniref:Lipase member N isoform X2 n=3 Tax=Acinonyx jubatus TaxID=32536 RepID=A0ABM3NUL8_ACIJB|nr:lipase member N isoform X2 [Acinonyx jubatus]
MGFRSLLSLASNCHCNYISFFSLMSHAEVRRFLISTESSGAGEASLSRARSSPIMATPVKSMKSPLKTGTSSASIESPTGEEMIEAQAQNTIKHNHFHVSASQTQEIHKSPRPVVYLQHALFADNASWLENYANGSLGFLLADAGYDVWMGNSRGNTWSRRHKTLSVTEEKFWAFSFDEMAKYDLPGIIDFIVNKTGQEKLYFIGHSLGTTIGFVAFCTMPELAQRIKMNFALGPVVSFKYPTGIFTSFFLLPNSIIKRFFGTKGFFLEDKMGKAPSTKICNNKILWVICSEIMSLWAGANKKNMNVSRMDVYMSHAPTGSSIQNILHIKQLYRSDEFRAYDWGSEAENMHHYNQSRPPLYDLTTMRVPTAMWVGGNDVLVTPQDVARILPQIRNLRYFDLLPDWNHFDFIWGLDAPQRVYRKIIDLMKSYS